jgi:hypothetical protein
MRGPFVLHRRAGTLLLLTLAGCSGTATVGERTDVDHLQKVATAYMQATVKAGRPPAGPNDLKPFLKGQDDVAALLVSPNDGQPYVILWGTDPRPGKAPSPLVIGYEKQGKNGQRFVFLDMGVVQMSEADFARANFPKGHKPD